jgi:EAL domain-containing protein (putative c-di-GMP-specific phosphodiesterase class I)
LDETAASEVGAGLVSFAEQTDDVVGICDAWGQLLYLNPAACKLLGIGSAEGLTLADVFPAESFGVFYDVARPELLERGSWSGEVVAKAAGSRAVRLGVSATMDLGPGGENRGLVLIGRVLGFVDEDLRAARTIEEELQEPPVEAMCGPRPLRVSHGVAFSTHADPVEFLRDAAPGVSSIAELQLAFSHGEIQAYAQAVIEPQTRSFVGYRGFARWHRRTNGLLGPADVAAICGDTTLAPVIDLYVARQTATLLIFARRETTLAQFTPASARLLRDVHTEQRFDEIAAAYSLAMHQFHLTIDARTVIDAAPPFRATLRSLADADLSLVLSDVQDPEVVDVDDLQRLGFRAIELSPQLLNDIAVRPALHYAVADLAERAHDADLLMSATGISNEQQHDTILRLRCDLATGDLYAPAKLTEVIAD